MKRSTRLRLTGNKDIFTGRVKRRTGRTMAVFWKTARRFRVTS